MRKDLPHLYKYNLVFMPLLIVVSPAEKDIRQCLYRHKSMFVQHAVNGVNQEDTLGNNCNLFEWNAGTEIARCRW